jgi:hypothetical protein
VLRRALEAASGADGEPWQRSLGPTSPPIAFHAWHIARWIDFLRDALTGPGDQIWDKAGLAERWGLAAGSLGYESTGMGMSDDAPAGLDAVPRAVILAYMRESIDAAIEALRQLPTATLEGVYTGHRKAEWAGQYPDDMSVSLLILGQFEHAARHLGMIEALVGVHGFRGSATQ